MTERSETRRELERRMRALVQDVNLAPGAAKSQSSATALTLIVAMVAFVWGRRRGRRRR